MSVILYDEARFQQVYHSIKWRRELLDWIKWARNYSWPWTEPRQFTEPDRCPDPDVALREFVMQMQRMNRRAYEVRYSETLPEEPLADLSVGRPEHNLIRLWVSLRGLAYNCLEACDGDEGHEWREWLTLLEKFNAEVGSQIITSLPDYEKLSKGAW